MDDLDQLLSPIGRRTKTCHAGLAIARLSDEDRAKLDRALADERVYATRITEWLNAKGNDLEPQNVQRHRRGGCTCRREP